MFFPQFFAGIRRYVIVVPIVGLFGAVGAGPGGNRTLAIEIAAHSRTINAMDLHPSSMLVS